MVLKEKRYLLLRKKVCIPLPNSCPRERADCFWTKDDMNIQDFSESRS